MPELTIQQAFELAMQHHQAGRLQEAEQLYRQILAVQPEHAGALHYLGVIASQAGQNEVAMELMRRAVTLAPDWAEAHSNLGLVLQSAGRLDEAIAVCRRAMALVPELPEAHNNLGNALQAKGKLDEAIVAHRQAIGLKPDYAEAHYNLGNALKARGQLDEAVVSYRQALAVQPNCPQAWNNLGNALQTKGQLDEAIAAYRQAIAFGPHFAEAYTNLAVTLEQLGQVEEAVTAYGEALRLKPDSAAASYALAAITGQDAPPAMPAALVVGLFDKYAGTFEQHLIEHLRYRAPEQLLETVKRVAPAGKMDVLDLGCGTGLCGVLLRPLARRLAGVDLSAAMLAKAREKNIYDELRQGELVEMLRSAPAAYDLLVATDVLIYLGDLAPLFTAATAALRPGGMLAVSVETLAEGDYALRPTKRYAHSLRYLRQLAQKHSLTELETREVVLRKELEQDVAGMLMVLRREGRSVK